MGVSLYALFDEGLLQFVATLNAKTDPKKIADRIRAEIKKVIQEGVSVAEVARARERILSQIADEHDGVFSEIRAVSESVAAGDWTLGYRFEEVIKILTKGSIQKAAQKYLVREHETMGYLKDTL